MDLSAGGLLAAIAARTLVVLVVLVVGIRVCGRRHAGEMNVYDLLLVLLMANAVQNAMTQANGRLLVALVSAGALLACGWLVGVTTARRPSLETRLLGSPTVIVHDGQVVWPNLKREGLTERELLAEIRKRGLAEVAAVKLAVVEVDGSVSVVPKEHGGAEGGGRRER